MSAGRPRPAHRLPRAAALSLAAAVAAVAWAPAAAAAPAVRIELAPPDLIVLPVPIENEGVLDPGAPDAAPPWSTVPVRWGGSRLRR